MKLKFKQQAYQTQAVEAVINCFKNQQNHSRGISYRLDPGIPKSKQRELLEESGFKNGDITLNEQEILENIQKVQRNQNLPQSQSLTEFKSIKKENFEVDKKYTKRALEIAPYHLDVEMETGTGKTYCYIKTIFELNRCYGWSKFIVMVPSIAIREGVYKTLSITADHFQESYGKKAKFFIYNSKQLHNLESFSSDAGINVMVINVQAFNAPGKDNRRIHKELDHFQSRRPIDVIKANRPILILDEPQKMEGESTLSALKEFNALFILRYSATHKKQHNKIHRLDALDAYNQKLVKKIAVRGISVKGIEGTNAYLYLESIEVSKQMPIARIEIEIKQNNGIKKTIRKLKKGDNLYDLSNGLDQYNGFVITDINANTDAVEFTNGHKLLAGEATGDVKEETLRRIQIREAIKAHFEKEQSLYRQGIKVLTLFFIDEVAKYRCYTDNGEEGGEYALAFEEEYKNVLNEIKQDMFMDENYKNYLNDIPVEQTHNGYFSKDKKNKRMINSVISKRSAESAESAESDDVDAYDLILKDKERLLSFEEPPVRFIFSHSALREGWDNPNVFVICTLKHSDNTISRRQEVGRGLRIAVNQFGERQDNPTMVHQTNVLTVVTNESYKDFVTALQRDISESLSERPRAANKEYFTDKVMQTADGKTKVTGPMAIQIYRYLNKNDYTDDNDNITQKYHDDLKNAELADLPEDLQPFKEQIFQLIDGVYSDAKLPEIENDRGTKINPLNDNFKKKEFKCLWNRINRKAAYSVHFNSDELVKNCISILNTHLRVEHLRYTIKRGEQIDNISPDAVKMGNSFEIQEMSTEKSTQPIHSIVKYDLIGKISDSVQLTRRTISAILSGIEKPTFEQFQHNPENFISEAIRLIEEQKATCIIGDLKYDAISETHSIDIFTNEQSKQDFSKAGKPLDRHIYDYVITDSKNERKFVQELDVSADVVVYAKLPKGFSIPTPVGNYNPDWAISFKEGSIKHVYFVAETKGSMSSMELRKIEETKIKCARKFFDTLNDKAVNDSIDSDKVKYDKVKYDVVDNFETLMKIVTS